MFRNFKIWLGLTYGSIKFIIGVALARAEEQLLNAGLNLNETSKKNQRMRHRNSVLEKMYAGKRDEKYVQDFYEILKGADKFMKNATPFKMEVAADKFSMSYGQKDKWGRRYEHYGFFDGKSKNAGKTLAEVLATEYEERRTKDDEYKLLIIYNNSPIEVGLTKALKTEVKEKIKDGEKYEFETLDGEEKSKKAEFPLKIYRDVECINRLEQLTEFLHIKRVYDEVVQLEFFIPLKYGTDKVLEDSLIFTELKTMKYLRIIDDYGKEIYFRVDSYLKRITHNNEYDVLKFDGAEIQDIGLY